MTDYKQLCAELADVLAQYVNLPGDPEAVALLRRARAALAQPEPVGAITAAEAERLAHEAGFSAVDSDEDELCQTFVVWEATTAQLMAVLNAAIALDRSRQQLQPEGPTDEEIMELMPQQMREDLAAAARAITDQANTYDTKAKGMMRIILNRHCVDHARAVLTRWGRPS